MTTIDALDGAGTRLALIRLAEQLGSVTEACRLMGYSRGSFYRIRARYLAEGEAGLQDVERRERIPANRVHRDVEALVAELARAHPEWGRRRVPIALAEHGIVLSPSGVRSIWKRLGLLTVRQRLHAASPIAPTDALGDAAGSSPPRAVSVEPGDTHGDPAPGVA